MLANVRLNDYRYGFNGKEKDDEGMGGGGSTYDYGFRIYNPQLAKFLSLDPLSDSYPWYTPYQFAGNTPIQAIDLDGLEEYYTVDNIYLGGIKGSSEVRIAKVMYDTDVENEQFNSRLAVMIKQANYTKEQYDNLSDEEKKWGGSTYEAYIASKTSMVNSATEPLGGNLGVSELSGSFLGLSTSFKGEAIKYGADASARDVGTNGTRANISANVSMVHLESDIKTKEGWLTRSGSADIFIAEIGAYAEGREEV